MAFGRANRKFQVTDVETGDAVKRRMIDLGDGTFADVVATTSAVQGAAQGAGYAGAVAARPSLLRRVIVTSTGSAGTPVQFFDNASAASGAVIAAIPGNASLGTVYMFDAPADNGIYCTIPASGPTLYIIWDN